MKTKVKLVGLLIGVALITSQSIYAQQTNVVPDSLKYAFKSLKALIIVGDESCDRFVNGAERLAEFLTSLGISVEELYPP